MIITGTLFMNQTIIFSEAKRFLVLQVFACDADLSDFCLVHHCFLFPANIHTRKIYHMNVFRKRCNKTYAFVIF